MTSNLHVVALSVFCAFFLAVTLAGFWASRWRKAEHGVGSSLEEWGLAGRSFGTLITWFLIGGDLYTAYTVIAVPAALYGGGVMGFFAVPYCIFIYPYAMAVVPRLWAVCHKHGYVTFADFVRGRFNDRWLTIAIAVTGILSLMPYIALQLVGMKVVIAAMGLTGEWPLIAAFVVLAAYTYSSGLRAPAIIAVVKDVMLFIMVLTAIIVLPMRLGGWGHIFAVAETTLQSHKPAASIFLNPKQYLPFSSLAIGSTIALLLYPHSATGLLSAKSGNVVRRNAALLPSYSLLLGLLALLGYVAIAAGVKTADTSAAIPLLFLQQFPEWFAGFCFAAIGIGALVPAAIMSIAAANLFTRNLWGELVGKKLVPAQEAKMAKMVSLLVKVGALAFVLMTASSYAIQMQLLGGIWIAQIFPAVVVGVFTRWPHSKALLVGWAAGMGWGTYMAAALQLKVSTYPFHIFGGTYTIYAAIPSLLLNLLLMVVLTPVFRAMKGVETDMTVREDYVG